MSPFQALYGYAPPQIAEINIPCDVTPECVTIVQEHEQMMKTLQYNLSQAQNKMKKICRFE
jgi:hypothetical protein